MRFNSSAVSSLSILFALATTVFGQAADDSDSVFGMTSVLEVHLQFTPKEWKKLQPRADVNLDFDEALEGVIEDAMAGRNFHSEKSSRPGIVGYSGVDHQYGMANVTIDDETVHGVGVRYKGNGTFFAGHATRKYSFKIDFPEFHDDLEFRGLKKINLNNSVTDPSMLREALSYELFREAGVPASRTGWAKVYLTVDGETDHKYLGLYLMVEQVDKRFLKRVYGSSEGLLVKPSTFGAFRYFGDDWKKYEAAYFPKTDPTPEQQQRLIEFARLVHTADDARFKVEIEDFLDTDEFLSFLAVNVILSNMDSFLGGSQNYYAYLEPTSNKFQLLPWDLDISFGAFEMLGTPGSRRDLSIDRPQIGVGSNRLIERILSISKFKQAYHERIEQLMESMFEEKKMIAQIDQAADFVRPLVAENGVRAAERFEAELADSPRGSPHALKYFVRQRIASVRNQLDGKSQGQHHSWESPAKVMVKLVGFAAAFLFAGMLNAVAWLWASIAGSRDSTRWVLLNMFLYPVAPIIYGFHKRKDIGRPAAIMVTCSFALMIVVVAAIIGLW
ncbi:MAG TPA: hypothetical protein EYG03_03640 [Planctomycetes bacterium]|nr:hypothetical protein [Planctomycetota bacterium]